MQNGTQGDLQSSPRAPLFSRPTFSGGSLVNSDRRPTAGDRGPEMNRKRVSLIWLPINMYVYECRRS